MADAIDKVIIANRAGMAKKYGQAGISAIDDALQRLIEADRSRGFVTSIVNIDNANEMARFGAAAIVNGKDERGTKTAVDAITDKTNPDYVVLLDGPDVIPHIRLNRIAGISDDDTVIESDLPYACDVPFSRKASDYLAVTRVVGRLPMTREAHQASAFAQLIDRCATHAPKQPGDAASYFSISAEVWTQSTQLSLSEIFGSYAALFISPPDGHPGTDPSLRNPIHFINCHGATNDPQFYGQRDDVYPVAMESSLVAPHVAAGSVVAAECCYGAELYDPALTGSAQPICMSYLLGGATAFMGSTTIAYGPADSNGQADLITQYFLKNVLEGASTGRAMLQARQRFVQSQTMSGPTNLKTLAQFVLYGDPSLVAVSPPHHAVEALATSAADATSSDARSGRKARRIGMKSDGLALAEAASYPLRRDTAASPGAERIHAIARQRGFSSEPVTLVVSGGPKFREAAKVLDQKQKVVVVFDRAPDRQAAETGVKLPSYRALVAYMIGDGIAAIEESESR